MKTLRTARLLLRPFQPADLDVLADLFRNPGFMRFSGGNVYTREQTAAVLEKFLGWTRAGLPSQFAVISGNQVTGFCGFLHQEVDGEKEIEIAYRLHPDSWGRGIGTEAARVVRDYAFRDLRLSRVISIIHPDNVASRRVAEKNGMRLEKETTFKNFPSLIFVMTLAEWSNLPTRSL